MQISLGTRKPFGRITQTHYGKLTSIIMEFCDNGDLFHKITTHRKKEKLMDENEIWNIFIQTVRGLKELHDHKIFHRDMKSANIFLMSSGIVKIGDLNVAKIAKKGMLCTQTGTPYYASPEVWKDKPYDSKSDVWSLGCILYEMAALKPPFRADTMEGLYKKVIKGDYDRIPGYYSQDLSNVISLMLQVKPNQRINCDALLELPMIQKRINEQLWLEVDQADYNFEMLNTIKVPQNLLFLSDKLPRANYEPLKLRRSMIPITQTSVDLTNVRNTNVYLSLNISNPPQKSESRNSSLNKKRNFKLPNLSNQDILSKKPSEKENSNVNSIIKQFQNRELKKKVEFALANKALLDLNADLMKINGLSLNKVASTIPVKRIPKNIKLAPIK